MSFPRENVNTTKINWRSQNSNTSELFFRLFFELPYLEPQDWLFPYIEFFQLYELPYFLLLWTEKSSHFFCTCSEKLSQTRARRHNERMTGRHNGRIAVERSFACCLHGFCLLRLSQWKNLLFVQVDWSIMGEITENESKAEFVDIQNENNANLNDIMRKSRKRKRATEPVRHFKTMRLAKEVRKRNLSWN